MNYRDLLEALDYFYNYYLITTTTTTTSKGYLLKTIDISFGEFIALSSKLGFSLFFTIIFHRIRFSGHFPSPFPSRGVGSICHRLMWFVTTLIILK